MHIVAMIERETNAIETKAHETFRVIAHTHAKTIIYKCYNIVDDLRIRESQHIVCSIQVKLWNSIIGCTAL